jgi:hypothetical protein
MFSSERETKAMHGTGLLPPDSFDFIKNKLGSVLQNNKFNHQEKD